MAEWHPSIVIWGVTQQVSGWGGSTSIFVQGLVHSHSNLIIPNEQYAKIFFRSVPSAYSRRGFPDAILLTQLIMAKTDAITFSMKNGHTVVKLKPISNEVLTGY